MEQVRAQVHAPPAYADRITELVTLAGLRPSSSIDLALLVTAQDDPSATDRWLVDSVPHLVMRLGAESIRLGPFVQPGVTACLRCVQVAGPTAAPAGPALAPGEQPDAALLMAGVGWAVRDLTTWHSGGLPLTWSSSITLTSHLQPDVERWLRHPHCGCSWGLPDHLADRRVG
ncbi:MAG: hypothetical protein JWN68_1707 [Nocardioides sp.]|jgi:hypothetical protein|uniref:hypothetical protein n=1 Tax=Nocardioides sp. TaxID=35761 RepID=UPI00262ACA32|nr:hypothetical protein [Nocardioides sp.]MCW2833754.1 hypothetical protein [Nocardioides sp.]